MVSIEVHGGHPPHDALRDAVDWGRVVVATLARGVVATLLGLALWAAAPAVIGWQPTTVMTGSMEPRLTPGDVVVSRPVSADEVRMGKILLADDPDRAGHLRMHRYVADGPGGTLVTKGDANPQPDSTTLQPSAVHGVAFLRVPVVGTPILWLRNGEWTKVAVLALALVGVLALCAIDGSLRRLASAEDPEDDGSAPDSGPGSGPDPADRADGGPEALVGAAPPLPTETTSSHGRRTARRHERRALRELRVRRLGGAAAVLVLAGGAGVLLPAQAVAVPWKATTGNPTSQFQATTATGATTFTCQQTSSNAVTLSWTYSGVAANSFDLMNGTTQLATSPGADRSAVYGGAGLLNLGTTYTLQLRTNLGSGWTALSAQTVNVKVVSVLGLASATCVP